MQLYASLTLTLVRGSYTLQDAIEAGKRGMFGALTRSVSEWRPDRLLCKRFGVPNPYPVESQDQIEEDKKQAELDKEMLNDRTMGKLMMERDRHFLDPESAVRTGEVSSSGDSDVVVSDKQEGIVEEDQEEEQPKKKPSLDIFKAIFADSDDEEDFSENEVCY
jgi:G patch domain-containing protein 1